MSVAMEAAETQEQCPVCSQPFSKSVLEAHAAGHFSSPGPDDEAPIVLDDGDEDGVQCPFNGCGQTIPCSELDSHEAAHRCGMGCNTCLRMSCTVFLEM